jgi:hypothetical protein
MPLIEVWVLPRKHTSFYEVIEGQHVFTGKNVYISYDQKTQSHLIVGGGSGMRDTVLSVYMPRDMYDAYHVLLDKLGDVPSIDLRQHVETVPIWLAIEACHV